MLFTGPSMEAVVQPAPTCGAPRFPTMTAREHLAAMAMSKSKEAQYKRAEAATREPSRAEPQLVIHDRHSAASLALPVAVEAGHLECTDLLLKAGASAEAMAASLLLAEHKGWHEVAALVRSALANLALQSEPPEAD